jgi:hypothetical protein
MLLSRGGHFEKSRFDRVHKLVGEPPGNFHPHEEGSPPGGEGSLEGSGPLHPLVAPVLSSFAGAATSVYLDFDGHFESKWGSYGNISTPAYDQDGDQTTFSDGELNSIRSIWAQVAEDYAPFGINVTTVLPSSFTKALRVSIGGNGAWTGGTYGGVAYVGSYTNTIPNTVFVFTVNLGNGAPRYTGEASSHEAGHAFGLEHQSLWNGSTLVQSYYQGPGDGRAPIMGRSYSATRGLWWNGTNKNAAMQDDMAILSASHNGFGYRADDHGDSAGTATSLIVSANQVAGSGIITKTSDVDYFSFTTDAGVISLKVSVPAGVNNLDAVLELRDSGGALVASVDPSTSFDATITATVSGGSYRLVVASHGGYGDVGQYTVSGTIIPPANIVYTPTGLTAANEAAAVDLAWLDNAANETGYSIERSTDGANWGAVASLSANATAYADSSVLAGWTYHYRVRAFNTLSSSDYSNLASGTVAPVAPGGLAAVAVSASRITIQWSDVAGETGYKIERSLDGSAWTQIGTTGANVLSYQDSGLNASTTYFYRVRATNLGGDSPFSSLASATTFVVPPAPLAPSNLWAAAVSAKQVNVTWSDNSANEDGFRLERSSNGGKSWTVVATVTANTTSFSDLTTTKRKTYQYRVRAFNGGGDSAISNVVVVSTPA